MDDQNNYYFNKYIDSIPQILYWEVDEIAIFLGVFWLGLELEHLYKFLILGCVIVYLIRKLKYSRVEGYFQHVLYYHGMSFIIGISDEPKCYEKQFIE